MKKCKILPVLLAAVLLSGLAGCKALALQEPDKPEDRVWTPAEYTQTFGDTDPWEGFNRSMFCVTDFGIKYFIRPVGWMWGAIFPRPFVYRMDMASENLLFPARSVSCMLQNRWKDAGIEFSRFLINTTLGLVGFFDPAREWFDLIPRDEDFGQAFASWGCGPGYTLVLPFLMATNTRDHIGGIFDTVFDLKTYIPYWGSYAFTINTAVKNYRTMENLMEAYADPYEIYKEYNVLNRQLAILDWKFKMQMALLDAKKKAEAEAEAAEGKTPPEPAKPLPSVVRKPVPPPRPEGISGKIISLGDYQSEDPWTDSVRSVEMQPQTQNTSFWVHLSPWNDDFVNCGEKRSLPAIFPKADDLNYRFWRSPDPAKYHKAPLVVLLPGIGGHYTNATAEAIAELLNRHGYAVLLLSNVYCFDFYGSRLTGKLPGYTPDDAESLRQTVSAILTDLAKNVRESKRFEPETLSMAGYSMGGLHALHIASMEEKKPILNLHKVVAINPPADLVYALTEVDRARLAAKGLSRDEVVQFYSDAFAKTMLASTVWKSWQNTPKAPQKTTEWRLAELPLAVTMDYRTRLAMQQSQILAATSFGFVLREVMMVACRDKRLGGLENKFNYKWNERTAFYLKVDSMGFTGYLNELVLPICRENLKRKDATIQELAHITGLRGIEPTLRNNRKVSILHNLNDFLISDRDRRYLDEVMGDRITWFDQGGHLGNLYRGEWQQELLDRLK